MTLTIIGTNDLHGALERLPIFAGFIANLRAARTAEGGGVVIVDGGDMFQGTLESNLSEGADVVRAYNQIGYTAVAIGNHEFDFGPAGPLTTPASIEDDARGALKARAAEAKYPFVAVNILDKQSGARIKWPNMPPSVMVDAAGIRVGIIGASTEATPHTTMPVNFEGLAMAPVTAAAIAEEAQRLREQGARVVIVTAHIGSRCKQFDQPNDLSSCEQNEELFRVIGDLPKGAIDVWVGGHTHAGIAHRAHGVAVIESFSSGRAFGRVDLRIAPDGHVTASKIWKPQIMCGSLDKPEPAATCAPGDYEGKPVERDPAVQKIVDEALAIAAVRRSEKLGVTVAKPVTRSHGTESAIGNLFCDLMRAARPEAHVAVTNGGGLRADLPAGDLHYGALFEANPFDNRFAIIDVKGADLRTLVTSNLQRGGAFLSWSGLAAKARCKAGRLDVAITVGGKPLRDERAYKLATSDFLASGGDGMIGRLKLPDAAIKMTDVIIREAMADVLRKKKGTIDPDKLFSPAARRVDYEGARPVDCSGPGAPPARAKPEPNE